MGVNFGQRTTAPGLAGKFFNGNFRSTLATGNVGTIPLTPANDSSNVTGTTGMPSTSHNSGVNLWPSIDFGNGVGGNYGFICIGYFFPPATGTYTFYTASDDGSGVWIGDNALEGATRTTGNAVLNNNMGFGQGVVERSGSTTLTKNVAYPIRIVMEEEVGGDALEFNWEGPGYSKQQDLTAFYRAPVNPDGSLTGDFFNRLLV